jgi:hypothetical protein
LLDREKRVRDRALFDLGIDSKLRGCDLVKIRIGDLVSGGCIRNRAIVIQQKTKRPVQFELLEPARGACSHGTNAEAAHWRSSHFRAASIVLVTSARGNMPGWSMNG